jgi:hypothetical protein
MAIATHLGLDTSHDPELAELAQATIASATKVGSKWGNGTPGKLAMIHPPNRRRWT